MTDSHVPRPTSRRTARPALVWLLGLVLLAVLTAPAVRAQDGSPGAGLHGTVIDATEGVPLQGATVTVEPLPAGLLPAGGPASFVQASRHAATDADGAYAFTGLGPGAYRVRVVRLGYRSRTIEVHYDGPTGAGVSVGLELAPVALDPIEVTTPRPALDRRVDDARGRSDRVTQERLRQARHTTPDARVVTADDLLEATTAGETDLLRALHRLPGVIGQDDWSAEPWTRGGNWDETRVFFDGMPLYDPMHLGGAFTGINPDGIGSMTFHPGVRPVDLGGSASGTVDLRTRRASPEDRITALGRLSFLSARFSADRGLGPGSGITVSGRQGLIAAATDLMTDPGDPYGIPYHFSDLSGRWDQRLGDRVSLEVSGLRTRNRIDGDVRDELKGARGTWGNTVGRATLELRLGGLRTRVTEGAARSSTGIDEVPWDESRPDLVDATTAATTRNEIRTGVTEVSVAPLASGGAPAPWAFGARWSGTRIDYSGPAPWPYPDAANAGALSQRTKVALAEYWVRTYQRLGPQVEVTAGLRLNDAETGGAGPSLDFAPRLSAAWHPTDAIRVSAAAGRHVQYEQALAAAGFTIGPGLVPGHLWVSARRGVPALRSDIVTAGAEVWLDDGWLASATAFARRVDGRLTPAPDSGYVRAEPAVVPAGTGPGWVESTTRATGLELSVRRLAGRWTGSAGYTLTRARARTGDVTYAAPGERAHAIDVTGALRAGRRLTIGGALTAASGAAYTRFYAFRCTAVSWYCPEVDTSAEPVIGFADPAGSGRTDAYFSLDLHVERTGTLWGQAFGLYGQVRNVLGRNNRSAYLGSILACDENGNDCSLTDRFDSGLPLLPFLGFWMRL